MNCGKLTLESMSQAVWYNQWTIKKFEQFLKGDILEVGCGIGNFTSFLTKYGNVWAIDINEQYVTEAKKKVNGKVKIGIGDVEKGNYFFKGQKFDSIVCLNVLEHIKNDGFALKSLYNLLEKGGCLILLVPAHMFLFGKIDKSIGHYRRYNKQQLGDVLKGIGFKIIKARILNMVGAIGWWFASKVLSNGTVGVGKIKLFSFIAPFVLPMEDIIEPPFGTSILIICQK
ncbi:MAG: hypothetical protein ACD_31C00110G0002 [uncultured bacterium]|nr:MAG: hypothetical protein ACD_31C00110G0002 [uncultured bacterium]